MDPHPAIASSMVKSLKYSSTQPMFGVLETPLHYRASHSNQDASFSSYLKSKDEKSQEKIVDDTEISIFDAQRYFSSEPKEMMKKQQPHTPPLPRLSSVSSTDARNLRTRSFHATPTASSEASWNSQTGLLANPPGVAIRNCPPDYKKRPARKWSFGRKCCCTGKKSVEVNKPSSLYAKRDAPILEINQQKIRSFPSPDPPPRQQRISASGRPFVDGIGGFSFPVLNNATQAALKPILTKPIINMNPLEVPPRDSLEVFQPPPPRVEDDVVSDASSDLFEIESFSTQTTSYRRRDSLDEAPTFNARRFATNNIQYGRRSVDEAGTECYAPSEVSIDWSVTTAEGFDRASVSNFSEVGRAAFLRQEEEISKKKGNGGMLLMSCRQEKAVSVGPQPVKCVEGAARPPRAGKPPLARLSVAFAA